MREPAAFVRELLDWYDFHARDLPWRVPAGCADPYRVWLSEIMLQQTTVVTVGPYYRTFLSRWPDIHALADADDADVLGEWAGLGYYARARNLLKCARVVSHDLAGVFPKTEAGLLALPGIGPYTAAAIAAIAYDLPATVVDGNVERVMARLYQVETPLPDAKPALKEHARGLTPLARAGDYAQALMDLGATVCTPRNPKCGTCPVVRHCAATVSGIAATLPRRKQKAAKPVRYGIAYVVQRADGAVLLETRPAKGLLGGMQAFPSSEWVVGAPDPAPPVRANWQKLAVPVKHVFTHFNLILSVEVALVGSDESPLRGAFVPPPQPDTLPSVMRKVYHLAQGCATMSQLD